MSNLVHVHFFLQKEYVSFRFKLSSKEEKGGKYITYKNKEIL